MGDPDFHESYLTDQEGTVERTSSPSYNIKYDTPKRQDKKQWSSGSGDHIHKDAKKKLNNLFSTKYIPSPPKRKWDVSYNNRNFIKSQLSQDILEHYQDKKKHENSHAVKVSSWKNKDGVN